MNVKDLVIGLVPPQDNIALKYLSWLVGNDVMQIPGVDASMGYQQTSLLRDVSAGLLPVYAALMVCIMVYIFTSGLKKTAQEQEVFGKKWDAFKTPMMMLLSAITLAPVGNTGSVVGQVAFIQMAMVGSNAADMTATELYNDIADPGRSTRDKDTQLFRGRVKNAMSTLICAQQITRDGFNAREDYASLLHDVCGVPWSFLADANGAYVSGVYPLDSSLQDAASLSKTKSEVSKEHYLLKSEFKCYSDLFSTKINAANSVGTITANGMFSPVSLDAAAIEKSWANEVSLADDANSGSDLSKCFQNSVTPVQKVAGLQQQQQTPSPNGRNYTGGMSWPYVAGKINFGTGNVSLSSQMTQASVGNALTQTGGWLTSGVNSVCSTCTTGSKPTSVSEYFEISAWPAIALSKIDGSTSGFTKKLIDNQIKILDDATNNPNTYIRTSAIPGDLVSNTVAGVTSAGVPFAGSMLRESFFLSMANSATTAESAQEFHRLGQIAGKFSLLNFSNYVFSGMKSFSSKALIFMNLKQKTIDVAEVASEGAVLGTSVGKPLKIAKILLDPQPILGKSMHMVLAGMFIFMASIDIMPQFIMGVAFITWLAQVGVWFMITPLTAIMLAVPSDGQNSGVVTLKKKLIVVITPLIYILVYTVSLTVWAIASSYSFKYMISDYYFPGGYSLNTDSVGNVALSVAGATGSLAFGLAHIFIDLWDGELFVRFSAWFIMMISTLGLSMQLIRESPSWAAQVIGVENPDSALKHETEKKRDALSSYNSGSVVGTDRKNNLF